jgi:hypothetical protein
MRSDQGSAPRLVFDMLVKSRRRMDSTEIRRILRHCTRGRNNVGDTTSNGLTKAIQCLSDFSRNGLTTRISELERLSRGLDKGDCTQMLAESGVSADILSAACLVKNAVGQINVIIHALGILSVVPKVLEAGEHIEYLSLGAGNTGRRFDLETDRRIAEFKFIKWQGGPESIRQNSLFKDFYLLAEEETAKRKELYVTELTRPQQFLCGGRAIKGVLRDPKMKEKFEQKYGDRFQRVRDYFQFRQRDVTLIDASTLVPELVSVVATKQQDQL